MPKHAATLMLTKVKATRREVPVLAGAGAVALASATLGCAQTGGRASSVAAVDSLPSWPVDEHAVE